ncbi:MAG: GWxTD domain-containing protein [Candidatus Krumholzibacteriota bacterium]|nr:GWxTD domain-containing protein [Candidatus Krumholzibacteriota bacterium]
MKLISGLWLLLFLAAALSCVDYKRPALDEDFTEPAIREQREGLEAEIRAVQEEIQKHHQDPALHRKLSVLYRLQGTIQSRNLSILEIDKALELEPDNPLNYVEKGLTQFMQSRVGEAEQSFKKALEIDPGFFPGWYQLARVQKYKYLKTMRFVEHWENAIRYYKKAYHLNNRHPETIFNLGFLHLRRGMTKTAAKFAKIGLELYPQNTRFHLLQATVYMEEGKFLKAEYEFSRALEKMEDEEKGDYLDTAPLLPRGERETYETWPDEEKLKWNRMFWVRHDPTPATEVNERLLAHYERVFLAKELLTLQRLELDGPDTPRGKALISYGLPDRLLYIYGAETDSPMIAWEYEQGDSIFRLYFMDEFLNGNYQIPIDPKFQQYAHITRQALNTIPQKYEYPVLYKSLPLYVQTAQSRDLPRDNKTKVEFSFAIPDSIRNRETKKFTLNLSIFDSEWNRLSTRHYEIKADSLRKINKRGAPYLSHSFVLELVPRPLECLFAIEITGGRPARRGVWKDFFIIQDLEGRSLKLSSVKFTLPGQDLLCSGWLDPYPAYGPGSTLCVSYEIYNLRRGESNLARYKLTYSIMDAIKFEDRPDGFGKMVSWISASMRGKKPGDKPYISSSLEQSINSDLVLDNLRINVSSLEPNDYMLVLDIEDLTSGQKATSRSKFSVID